MNQFYNPQGFQPYSGTTGTGGMAGGATPGGQGFNGGMPGTQSGGFPVQPGFPQYPPAGAGTGTQPGSQVPGMLPIEQSYIENILRLNKGKLVTVFATFEGNNQWNAKEFKGIIEAAGRDHVILSDPQSGTRYLIPMIAVDYITFSEEIEYEYPFGAGASLSTFPPR
ncbi:spore coat protein GerQ [Neobacillus sedimentimangrovi]|jgi:spore germination protein Q|uniref:spore coat protein GerQ n=1 Tax=Neobacillus sedimentimangrovi TaxID=2699460 RepID=UPI0013D4962B